MRILNISFLVSFFLFCSMAAAEEITLAIDNWCPFICSPFQEKPNGIMLDIIREIFESEGKKITFQEMPLTRSVYEVKLRNNPQGVVGVVKELDSELIYPSEPIYTTQLCFFVLPQKEWKFEGFNKVYSDIQMGVIGGMTIDTSFKKSFPKSLAIFGTDEVTLRLIKLLYAKHIDAFVEEKNVVKYALQKNRRYELKEVGCLKEKNEYIAFSPKNVRSKEYAEIFSRGMNRIKNNGRMNEIVRSYLNPKN